jgi:hypothetical protein
LDVSGIGGRDQAPGTAVDRAVMTSDVPIEATV